MENKIKQPFFLVLGSILLLSIASYLPIPHDFSFLKYKPYHLLSDIQVNELDKKDSGALADNQAGFNNSALANDSNQHLANDSNLNLANNKNPTLANDSNQRQSQTMESSIEKKLQLPKNGHLIMNYGSEDDQSIIGFFKLLANPKPKIRIAYFGDSFIEADFFTDEIRNALQAKYGGTGIGLIPMQSIVADEYSSIQFGTSRNWQDQSFVSNSRKTWLAPTGHSFFGKGNSSTTIKSRPGKGFDQIKLYTGKANSPANITLSLNNQAKTLGISNQELLTETLLYKGAPLNQFQLKTSNTEMPFYGLSFEQDRGIYLDNFGFRANTSMFTLQLNPTFLKEFQKKLNYDLIIVHYGLNVPDGDQTNFTWFQLNMRKVLKIISQGFEGVPVLLISCSDLAKRVNGVYQTNPTLPYLLATQEKIAKENKMAYWNLFEAMGGENSMVNWVANKDAYQDYMHLTKSGGKKLASIFIQDLFASKAHYLNQVKK